MRVSVVIPTLNEAYHIAESIRSAVNAGADEVIVSDGGSSDDTVGIATGLARVVSGTTGRARQMNRGASSCGGDVLLFLHADTRLAPECVPAMRQALGRGADAGCFRLRFDSDALLLRSYGWFTALPLNSLCFGDRAIFVRRELFDSVGGYSDIPIFEDLDLVKRLDRAGHFVRLPVSVETSSRRFDDVGRLRQQTRNLVLWSAYHLGVKPGRLARFYTYSRDPS